MDKQMTPEEFRNIVAENVCSRRKELKMTQADLADACGWFQPKISNIEAANQGLHADGLAVLAEALKTTPAALVSPGNFSPLKA